jgi:hypothetical protein
MVEGDHRKGPSTKVKHRLDFSFVFLPYLPEETCFQPARSSVVEGTSQVILGFSHQQKVPSQVILGFSHQQKVPARLYWDFLTSRRYQSGYTGIFSPGEGKSQLCFT